MTTYLLNFTFPIEPLRWIFLLTIDKYKIWSNLKTDRTLRSDTISYLFKTKYYNDSVMFLKDWDVFCCYFFSEGLKLLFTEPQGNIRQVYILLKRANQWEIESRFLEIPQKVACPFSKNWLLHRREIERRLANRVGFLSVGLLGRNAFLFLAVRLDWPISILFGRERRWISCGLCSPRVARNRSQVCDHFDSTDRLGYLFWLVR